MNQAPYWTQIWNSTAVPKLNMWAWQASNNGLPSNQNLAKRKILTNTVWSYCGSDEESLNHIFYKCKFAIETRSLMNCKAEAEDFPDIMTAWSNVYCMKGLFKLWTEIYICWKLWNAWDKRLFGNLQHTPYIVAMEITTFLYAGFTPVEQI